MRLERRFTMVFAVGIALAASALAIAVSQIPGTAVTMVRLADAPGDAPLHTAGAAEAGWRRAALGRAIQLSGSFSAERLEGLDRPALLAPAAMIEPRIFVNGAPLFEPVSHGPPSPIAPGAARVTDLPRHYWHSENRLDILTEQGLTGSISTTVFIGERNRLERALARRGAVITGLHALWPGLGALCAALAAALSVAAGRSARLAGFGLAGLGACAAGLLVDPHAATASARALPFWFLCAAGLAVAGAALGADGMSRRRFWLTAGLWAGATAAVMAAPHLGGAGSGVVRLASLAGLCASVLPWLAMERSGAPGARAAGAALSVTAAACLVVQGGWLTGPGLWTMEMMALLAVFASLLTASGHMGARLGALAIQALRDSRSLLDTVRRQRAELDAASIALADEARQRAILEERQRLVRDMHDGIGGQLASLMARLQTSDMAKDQIERAVHDGLKDLRLIVDSLDSAGDRLGDALRAFQARAAPQLEAAGISLDWRQDDRLSGEVNDPQAILMIFRWLQEAVTNSARHSGASRCVIEIGKADGAGLAITVRDDGRGIPADAEAGGGKGLRHLDQRAQRLGGRFERGAGPDGSGTEVRLIVPRLAGVISPGDQ